jgi:hypothetical protein
VTGQGQPALFPRAENQPLAPAPQGEPFYRSHPFPSPLTGRCRAPERAKPPVCGAYIRGFRLKLFGNSFAYGFIATSDCQYNLAYFLKKRYDVKI